MANSYLSPWCIVTPVTFYSVFPVYTFSSCAVVHWPRGFMRFSRNTMRKSTLAFLLLSAFAALPMCSAQTKRPMTFEDMMKMKRLGETAVSPDGKWLAYSVTSVNLDQNTKTTEWWLQAIAGGEPMKLAVGQPGDGGVQFAPDGRSVRFLSGRDGGQQIWLADFNPTTGTASNAKKLTAIATEADNAKWSPDGKSIVFTSDVYPDCPAIAMSDFEAGNNCNAVR